MSQSASRHDDAHVHYPESDGQPVAETEVHVEELLGLFGVLRGHFRDAGDVYVGANMFVYYERGNPRAVFAPDVFVVRGIPKQKLRTYKLWERGKPPSFVMEVSSDSTWLEDTGNKKALCARLGVEEYFLFDPLGDYLEPRLQGFLLKRSDYERIAPARDGSVESRVLGLRLHVEGTGLRCENPVTGERLIRLDELHLVHERLRAADRRAHAAEEQAHAAEEHAHAAEERASAAEAELERLRRQLAASRGSHGD
jgi:Uma2 family endonuclease